ALPICGERRLGPGEPEAHTELAEQAGGGAQMLRGLRAVTDLLLPPAEPQPGKPDERAHLELGPQGQRAAERRLDGPASLIVAAQRDLAQQPPRPGLTAALLVLARDVEGALGRLGRLTTAIGQQGRFREAHQ